MGLGSTADNMRVLRGVAILSEMGQLPCRQAAHISKGKTGHWAAIRIGLCLLFILRFNVKRACLAV